MDCVVGSESFQALSGCKQIDASVSSHFAGVVSAELAPALKLLGHIEEKFVAVSDLLECTDTGRDSNIFVSNSFDATSHFESATQDVLRM